jgi:hypothetical protein
MITADSFISDLEKAVDHFSITVDSYSREKLGSDPIQGLSA